MCAQPAGPQKIDPAAVLWLRRYVVAATVLSVLIAGVVLSGWILDVRGLRAPLPGPAMPPNSAALALLSGLALWLRRDQRIHTWKARVARLAAASAVIGATAMLAEHVFEMNLGIDALLVPETLKHDFLRPAPDAAFSFILLGAALLLLDRGMHRGHRPTDDLVQIVASLTILATTAFALGAAPLPGALGALGSPGMTPTVALLLLLLSTAALCVRPEVGLAQRLASPYLGGKILRRFLMAIPILIAAGWLVARGLSSGLFDAAYAAALLTLAAIALGSRLAITTAARIDRLHEIEGRMTQRLDAIARASHAVNDAVASLPTTNVQTVLRTIAEHAKKLARADYAALGIGTHPDEPFDPWVFVGIDPEHAASIGQPPRPRGTLGAVARHGELIRARDVRKHPAFHGFPAHHPVMSSFLGVPIRHQGKPVGNIYLANKRGDAEFTEDDQHVVETFADRVGAEIGIARLYESESAQHAWLNAVLEQMPDPIVLVDAEGRVRTMNQCAHAHALGGTGQGDPRGKPVLFDLRRPSGEPVPVEELPLARAIRGESTSTEELALRRHDGGVMPVVVSATAIRDSRGELAGAALLMKDITPIKEVERLREEWTSIVAHDLRQPVGVLSLMAQTLARREASPIGGKDVERLRRAATTLDRMIGDLQDASRIQTRRLTIQREELPLGPFLREVVDRIRPQLEGFQVEVEERGQPCAASVDPARVEQVLGNLLGNAAKYGEPGTEVRVRAEYREDAVEVTVTNSGVGIPADDLPKIFDRFFRTRDAREGSKSGLGVGLYISRGLVETHGGRMWAESVPGEKTTFHFTLPLVMSRT